MATLADINERLKRQREISSEGSPVSSALGKTIASLDKVSGAVIKLQESVQERMAMSLAAKKVGKATDVQQTIRELLQAKLVDDKIEGERHKRMMDMAETLVPQVTEEQLKAFRMQQLVAREHKKTLEVELNIEQKKYDLQKKDAEAMQKRRVKAIEAERKDSNFALKDKYGTIESAISGFGNSGGDSFGKFLVSGLNRYVKERKEDPVAEAIKEKYDSQVQRQGDIAEAKKALADREFSTNKSDIEENAAIRAARMGIADPGSASKLYADRNQQVSELAKMGEGIESALVSGKASFEMPKMESALADVANAIRGEAPGVAGAKVSEKAGEPAEVPVLTKEGIKGSVVTATTPNVKTAKPAEKNESLASTLRAEIPQKQPEAKPMPKNAKMRKAPRQSSSLLTPVAKRSATTAASTAGNAVASVGKFGSKAGAVSLGGIGPAIGGIAAKMGTLASSSLKFLGPWGMVASAIMSFDRLVPIVSSGAGALMDLSKLLVPLMVTALVEGFAGLLGALNTLINVIPWTTNMDKSTAERQERYKQAYMLQADDDYERWQKTKNAITNASTSVNTTSSRANRAAGTGVAMYRREMSLTTPTEQAAISAQSRAMTANAPALSDAMAASMQEQTKQNEAMREAVLAAAKNPGTTPIMAANPALAPYVV